MNGTAIPVLRRLGRAEGKARVAFLSPGEMQAGERIWQEFQRAALQPRVSQGYEFGARAEGGLPRGDAACDMAMDCRRRVHRALDAVGPELAGIVVDVCCLERGLEEVERDRCWPVRSAKIVLKMALGALARHYGYDDQATGPERNGGFVRRWRAEDAHPAVRPAPALHRP